MRIYNDHKWTLRYFKYLMLSLSVTGLISRALSQAKATIFSRRHNVLRWSNSSLFTDRFLRVDVFVIGTFDF